MKKNVLIVALVLVLALVSCAEHECVWKEISATEPTCSAEGERVFKCEGCGATRTEKIEKLPHTFGEWQNADDFKTNTRECSVCHETETRDGIVVNPTNAQELINSVNTGKVYFTAGEYGDLSLTHSKKVSTVKERSSVEDVDINNLDENKLYEYYRQIEKLELIGESGVVVSGSIVCNSSHRYGSEGNTIIDPIRGTTITGIDGSYYSHLLIDGIVFKGFAFVSGGVAISSSFDDSYGKNIAVRDCIFSDESNTLEKAINFMTDNTDLYENISVISCEADGYKYGIYGQNINGVTIESCHLSNLGYNAIQLTGNNGVKGSVEISDNTIAETKGRAIRLTSNSGASISVEGNSFINSIDKDGQLMKAAPLTNCTYSFTGNTYNGESLSTEEGSESSWIVTIPTEEV